MSWPDTTLGHRWFKYVAAASLHDYLDLGWIPGPVTYQGAYMVFLMEYRCCCRTFTEPPISQTHHKRRGTST